MSSGSCFSSVFLLPQFFLWMWVAALFFKSPSALFWVFALQLLVEKTIMFDFTTVYQSLCTMFSWFCSFHSASVPGDYSRSHGISPIHYSFEHNSIPSPTYTTICSAIPQLKGILSFSNFFASTKSAAINIFVQVILPMISLGYKPSSLPGEVFTCMAYTSL